MNESIHFNPKWRNVSLLFFGLVFFLMGFGGFLMERRNLVSDTIRYLEKAGSYTALRESIKELNNEAAIPAWSDRSGIELIFCYPATLGKAFEGLKTRWSNEYLYFDNISFYPIFNAQSWVDTLNRLTAKDPSAVILGYRPVYQRSNAVHISRHQIYLRIPASIMNSFPEELIDTVFGEKPFSIHMEPGANGMAFALTWEETQNSKVADLSMNLPEPVTEILTRLNLFVCSRASLY